MGVNWVSSQRGERHHRAKLTGRKVRMMRRLHEKNGLCMACVARLYHVNRGTAFDAITYRTWVHIK